MFESMFAAQTADIVSTYIIYVHCNWFSDVMYYKQRCSWDWNSTVSAYLVKCLSCKNVQKDVTSLGALKNSHEQTRPQLYQP